MSAVRVLLQARVDSTRLPAKVLLPIKDIPLVVLIAKRVMQHSLDFCVVTSTEISDDPLVNLLEKHQIPYFRGDKTNVLQRFVDAAEDMTDDDVIVRLTGDNAFLNAEIIQEMVAEFLQQDDWVNYGIPQGQAGQAPYGFGIEVLRLKYLRQACQAKDLTSHDKEHVTPWLNRTFQGRIHAKVIDPQDDRVPSLRCTCDLLSDYYRLNRVFDGVDGPIQISWQELFKRLVKDAENEFPMPVKLYAGYPRSELVLGTAQLGMDYGITNHQGKPSIEVAKRLLDKAIALGITSFDTAYAYGDSETILGQLLGRRRDYLFEFITKYPPFVPEESDQTPQNLAFEAPVLQSMARLKQTALGTYLLHRATHLNNENLMQHLRSLKAEGYIEKLGVSVQTPEELTMALSFQEVEHIQLPINILDWRWDEILSQPKPAHIRIHARSVFLQGLLAQAEPGALPKGFERDFQLAFQGLSQLAENMGMTLKELAIQFVRGLDWIDELVMGVVNASELEEIAAYFQCPPLNKEQVQQVLAQRPKVAANLLNPANWS